MSSRVPQTIQELEAHLKEQTAFLEASAESYDRGFQGEAKRLAVGIRLLVHDHGSNKALLAQLDRLDSTRFYDSGIPNTPGNLSTYSGLVVTAHTKTGAEYMPMLDDHQLGPGEWLAFARWWETTIFVDNKKRLASRKDLILSMANQDGGAHVDPALNATYSAAVIQGGPAQVVPAFLGPRLIVPAAVTPQVGRNDPCFCGSGKKYKRCHGAVR